MSSGFLQISAKKVGQAGRLQEIALNILGLQLVKNQKKVTPGITNKFETVSTRIDD
jgi:hypothetical protein